MPDFFDRFVQSAGVLTGTTSDSGDVWGPTGCTATSLTGTGYAYKNANVLATWYSHINYSSWTPPSSSYSVKFKVGPNGPATTHGPCTRCSGADGSEFYYFAAFSGTSLFCFFNNGGGIGQVGTTTTITPSVVGDVEEIQATGTGATVTITILRNGIVLATIADSGADRITTTGSAGFVADTNTDDTASPNVVDTLWAGAIGGPVETIAPSTPTVALSGTQAFTAAVALPGGTYTWRALHGTITGTGAVETYTAPASGFTTDTVTWTSVDLPTQTASANVVLTGGSLTNVALSGPASGFIANESTAFTATLNATASGGGVVVNLVSSGVGDVFHGVTGGGTVTTVTIPSGQNSHTFFLVPATTGFRNVSITSGGLTVSGSPVAYTANAQTLAVSPTTLMTSSTTVVTFTGGGTHYTVSAPTFTPTGVAGVTAGSVTVVNDTTATVSVTTGTAVGTVTWTDSTTSATATQAVSTAPVISTTTVLSVVQGFASGLNTVGYAVYNPDGTLYSAFTTAGVNERGTGSGNYGAVVTIPSPGTAEIRWSIGGVAPFAVDVETTAQMAVIAPNGWDEITLESGINARQGMALALDAMCSLLSGATAAASTILVKDPTGAHARISANVDKFGNRSSVTLTPPA